MMQKTSTDAKNHINQFSYIRIIACLFIVLLHTVFASTIYYKDTAGANQILFAQMTQHLLMWAVPCFLMVTGALLLQPEKVISAKKLYGKYIRRVAVALIVFTLVFQIIDFKIGEEESIVKGWLSNLFQGHSWAHMWYLYLMIGLYLMIPFYKMITEKATDRQLWCLTGIIILFVSILPMVQICGLECGFYIPTAIIYPAYMLMGYLLFKNPVSYTTAIIMTAVPTGLLAGLSLAGVTADIFGYDSILVIIQAAGIFSLMNMIQIPVGRFVKTLDDCTFGIYLIHMVGVKMTMKVAGFNPYKYGPLAFAAMVIAFFIAAFILTFIWKSIIKIAMRPKTAD